MSARAQALPVLTVVLEWDDGEGGGASEEGRAPAGSAELAAAVARASEEAASLAEGGSTSCGKAPGRSLHRC
ncbi:hypothetical protein, partial [Thermophilibacter provencensis]|uniref:hypothetical protein n=1 Tax=Thermophilibacter provencensis TaxID=1852386 RepID=UPI003AA9BAF5